MGLAAAINAQNGGRVRSGAHDQRPEAPASMRGRPIDVRQFLAGAAWRVVVAADDRAHRRNGAHPGDVTQIARSPGSLAHQRRVRGVHWIGRVSVAVATKQVADAELFLR